MTLSTPERPRPTLHTKLDYGAFVVTGELLPPRDSDATAFRNRLREVAGVVDAVNLPDNPGASVHASALTAAAIALAEGVEPIVQITCRDRNRMALQSDLIGAALLGVEAVLIITGDPPETGDHPDAKPVFDLDSFGLIGLAATLRNGTLDNGKPLRHPPQLLIGAAESPFAGPVAATVDRLERKVDAGAQFVQTQFVYDVPRFADWLAEVHRRGLHERVKILAGVGPVHSARTARWLQQHLPGSNVPDWLIAELDGLPPAEAETAGIRIAATLIRHLRGLPGLAGVHLMPVGWPAGLRLVAHAAGLDD